MEILCVGAHAMSIVTRSARPCQWCARDRAILRLEQNVVLVGHGVYNAGSCHAKAPAAHSAHVMS